MSSDAELEAILASKEFQDWERERRSTLPDEKQTVVHLREVQHRPNLIDPLFWKRPPVPLFWERPPVAGQQEDDDDDDDEDDDDDDDEDDDDSKPSSAPVAAPPAPPPPAPAPAPAPRTKTTNKRKRSDNPDADDDQQGGEGGQNDEEVARRLHAELNGLRARRPRRG